MKEKGILSSFAATGKFNLVGEQGDVLINAVMTGTSARTGGSSTWCRRPGLRCRRRRRCFRGATPRAPSSDDRARPKASPEEKSTGAGPEKRSSAREDPEPLRRAAKARAPERPMEARFWDSGDGRLWGDFEDDFYD